MNHENENQEIRFDLYNSFDDILFYLKVRKKDFQTTETMSGNTKTILVEGLKKRIFSKFQHKNFQLFSLLAKVKKDARIYTEKQTEISKRYSTASYVSMNVETLNKFGKCYKVDIKAAYWNAALRFLSNETYEAGVKFKKNRLIALGNLAKKTKCYFYENGEINHDLTEINQGPYAYLFFQIAEEIDTKLKFCIDNGAFGYFVDCFFCLDLELTQSLIDYLNAFDFECSFDYVNYRVFNTKIVIDNKEYPIFSNL